LFFIEIYSVFSKKVSFKATFSRQMKGKVLQNFNKFKLED